MYAWVRTSPAERNWALHERIHENRPNGLDFTKLTDMVEMCTNKKLLACRQRRRGLVLPWGDLEEGLDDVPEPRRLDTLPPGSLTDEEIRRQARKMQRASTVHHPPSVETVFGHRAAHIELYNEEIKYEPPTDPQAADEMEAEAWTDPEDLEQGCSDTADAGEDSGGESDHGADSDMRCDDGDVADDVDFDNECMVDREHPDPVDEHGFDDGDGGGPCDDGAGSACVVTPDPDEVVGRVIGGQGCGLDVPQGSIPSGIFGDDFNVGGPPTSDSKQSGVRIRTPASDVAHHIGSVFGGANSGMLREATRATGERDEGKRGNDIMPLLSDRDVARRLDMDPEDVLEEERLRLMGSGCATTQQLALEQDTMRAREMGCTVEEVTVAQLAAECTHGGPADAANGGGFHAEGHEVDRANGNEKGTRGRVDRVVVGGAAMEDMFGDRNENVVADHTKDDLVAVDDVVAHRIKEGRQVDGAVVAAAVEARVSTMSPLERHTAGIDPLMGTSRHISQRLWKAVPSSSFVPVSPPVPSVVSGHIGNLGGLWRWPTCSSN
ncbi:hypothetical protein CBR_g55401 [Chara braunii]|uniref:Uncharacterized protein n=1 Tax=Chara braunii TaxID=69332 RepID=A0A388K7N6_CHABU|nr:hypothetical protein CBR_g55401 [Chara braunii]|eukprot:GBG66058.1 hypothetical protein CBR_g55401 [Chara braunii]